MFDTAFKSNQETVTVVPRNSAKPLMASSFLCEFTTRELHKQSSFPIGTLAKMSRLALFSFVLALTLTACVPRENFDARELHVDCILEVGQNCRKVCLAQGKVAIGYASVRPFAMVGCVCKEEGPSNPKPHSLDPGIWL